MEISYVYGSILVDFIVAVVAVAAVVLYFECVDSVVFAAGAVHTWFVDCIPAVVEIVVVHLR